MLPGGTVRSASSAPAPLVVCCHGMEGSHTRVAPMARRFAAAGAVAVCFDFRNSAFFYLLGRISWQIRTLRVPTEAFNKRGRTADVYIGAPIPPATLHTYPDDTQLADFLYRSTYALPQKG